MPASSAPRAPEGVAACAERTLYLARHGETDWNRVGRWQGHSDVPLNQVGRAQARALAERLREHGIGSVGASDLSRAHETARIVAELLGIPEVWSTPDLRERCFGVFEGLTRDECSARFPEHWAAYHAQVRRVPPGAEAPEQVAVRVRDALTEYLARASHESGAVLIVSHGAAIRAFLASVTGCMPEPLVNGATYRVRFAQGRFWDCERVG